MIPWILSPRVAGSPGAAAPALLTFPSHDPLSPAATPCARGEVPLPIFHPGPMLEPDHLPSRSVSSVGRSRPFLASPLLRRSITATPWFQMARVCSASSTLDLERSKLSGGLDRFLGKLQVSRQPEHKSRYLSVLAKPAAPVVNHAEKERPRAFSSNRPVQLLTPVRAWRHGPIGEGCPQLFEVAGAFVQWGQKCQGWIPFGPRRHSGDRSAEY
ncbi:unnamed protein product [Urochloa humidicola]